MSGRCLGSLVSCWMHRFGSVCFKGKGLGRRYGPHSGHESATLHECSPLIDAAFIGTTASNWGIGATDQQATSGCECGDQARDRIRESLKFLDFLKLSEQYGF